MPLIFCLVDILTQFRPLFNRQNFALFCTFIIGLITHRHRADVDRHLSSGSPEGRLRFIGEVPFPWQMG